MNAKELRQAAERVSDRYHHDTATIDPDLAVDIAGHILATVREDDDELIDSHWIEVGVPLQLLRQHIDHIKTRGDFRTLCRLLGVKLQEPQ